MEWNEKVSIANKDLKTNKTREDLKIKLTDKEYSNLKLLAYKAGFASAADLLGSFVGDLTGWHSNGSDERGIANDWYNRAFGCWVKYFRHYLFNFDYDLDTMQDMIDDPEYFNEVYQEYKEENFKEEIESKEDCLKLLKELIKSGQEL